MVAPADAESAGLCPGAYVVFTVSDTGVGMSQETQARAVEPFFTTKGTAGGTGLGLSSVYGFANQSGGRLAISSHQGRGTVVSLYIPRADGLATSDVAPMASSAGDAATSSSSRTTPGCAPGSSSPSSRSEPSNLLATPYRRTHCASAVAEAAA